MVAPRKRLSRRVVVRQAEGSRLQGGEDANAGQVSWLQHGHRGTPVNTCYIQQPEVGKDRRLCTTPPFDGGPRRYQSPVKCRSYGNVEGCWRCCVGGDVVGGQEMGSY